MSRQKLPGGSMLGLIALVNLASLIGNVLPVSVSVVISRSLTVAVEASRLAGR
jgi:hypothetical protein